jgi:hypothetical protein
MSSALITLSEQAPTKLPPPSVLAPRTNPNILLTPPRNFTFGVPASSSATTLSAFRDLGTPPARQQATSQRPLTVSLDPVPTRIEGFVQALTEAIELCNTMIADGEGDPIDAQTLLYAIQSLVPLIISLEMPPPLVLPLQNGGIGAEWHTYGMNIELRVRQPYDIYAVLEDARGVFASYHGRDPYLVRARSALHELSARVAK